jgi:predicted RNA binding protein YcfA (HicA-like mRNA interferase family)
LFGLVDFSKFVKSQIEEWIIMRLTPITRRDLIKRLRNLGWDGPFSGGKHQFMVRGAMKLPIPNPHGGVLGVGMVSEILKETEISREEWLSAD